MENLIRMHEESKPEILSYKSDFTLEKFIEDLDPDLQKELYV